MEKMLTLKHTTISISWLSILWFLGIDHTAFALYTALLFIDFITGVIKGIVFKNLSSSRAINWFFSKFLMLLVIFSFGIFWKINDYDMSYVLSFTFFALSLAELYSILANIYEIRTRKKLPEYDAVWLIIWAMLAFIRNKLNKLNNDVKNQK